MGFGKSETENQDAMKAKRDLFVGIDVGSSFVHYTVLAADEKIVYCPRPIMHFANPIGAVKQAWRDITEKVSADRIKNTPRTFSLPPDTQDSPSRVQELTSRSSTAAERDHA